jgi:hypothetical protein
MAVTAVIGQNEDPGDRVSPRGGWRLTPKADKEARRSENRGRLWLVLSYVLCPCHLPLTMGLIVAMAGGTAVGAALSASMWRLGVVMTVLYGLSLWRGFHHLRRAKVAIEPGEACSTRWCET